MIKPSRNSPDKTLYDVTFALRFCRGEQMIVREQLGYVLL